MRLQRQSNHQILTFAPPAAFGRGGEACIYPVPHASGLAAKIYHQPTGAHARKLVAMLARPPADPMLARGHVSLAWPIDLLLTPDRRRQCVGFLMPRVTGMHPIIDFYNPKTRRQQRPWFDYARLHRTARNLAACVRALHRCGYIIGDVNESNMLVAATALVTLVDTDSFQVRDPHTGVVYHCPVGKPEFTPPEMHAKLRQGNAFATVARAPEHDLFGLAVLIFHLLMEGTHPFAGRFQGRGEPPPVAERIAAGHFPYGRRRVPYGPARTAPPFDLVDPTLQRLFVRCFEEGHAAPDARPDAQTWQDALAEAEHALIPCAANTQHWYGHHLHTCPWCARAARLGGRDPFPAQRPGPRGPHPHPGAPARRPRQAARPQTPPSPPTRTIAHRVLTGPRRGWVWAALVVVLWALVRLLSP